MKTFFKTIYLVLALLLGLVTLAQGERSVTLAWDPNPAEDMVASYALIIDGKELPKTEATTAVVVIPDTKTTITVIAYTAQGLSSPPSAPLIIPASPSNPKGLRVTAILRTTVSTPSP